MGNCFQREKLEVYNGKATTSIKPLNQLTCHIGKIIMQDRDFSVKYFINNNWYELFSVEATKCRSEKFFIDIKMKQE